jgi:hypothetical protein
VRAELELLREIVLPDSHADADAVRHTPVVEDHNPTASEHVSREPDVFTDDGIFMAAINVNQPEAPRPRVGVER